MVFPMINCRVLSWHRKQGFAYLWTLLLVALMGVGLTVGAEIYSTSVRRDKEKELLFIGHQFRDAIGRYYENPTPDGKHVYPATLSELIQDTRFPDMRRYLRRIYIDPLTGKSEWGLVTIGGRIVGVHSLSEKEPIKVDGFEPSEAAFRGEKSYSSWVFSYSQNIMLHQMSTESPVLSGDLSSHQKAE